MTSENREEIEALQGSLQDLSKVLGFLSTRSFATTIQMSILNLACIGGLLSGKIVLPGSWRIAGFSFLLALNATSFWYLAEKSKSFRICWQKARWIERRLSRHLSPSLRRLPRPKYIHRAWPPTSDSLFKCQTALSGIAALCLILFWPNSSNRPYFSNSHPGPSPSHQVEAFELPALGPFPLAPDPGSPLQFPGQPALEE